jgi:hypothetical protein
MGSRVGSRAATELTGAPDVRPDHSPRRRRLTRQLPRAGRLGPRSGASAGCPRKRGAEAVGLELSRALNLVNARGELVESNSYTFQRTDFGKPTDRLCCRRNGF